MRIKTEVSGLKIGIDGSITESIKTGQWGIRLTFTNEQHNSRFETAISREDAILLIHDLQKSIDSIDEVKKIIGK